MPKIFQQTPPQADGSVPPLYVPASDLTTLNPLRLRDQADTRQWLFVWANYCRTTTDANPPEVNGRRFRFSSIAKANMATLANLRSAFYDPAYGRALCRNHGLRFCLWGDEATLATMPVVGGHYRDVAYCAPYIKDKVTGFILDYECGDHRSPTLTSAFFRRVVGELSTTPRLLYTNQIHSAGYVSAGLAGIEAETSARFHGVTIFQDRNERQLAAQKRVFGSRGKKAIVTIDLRTNDLDSVRYARNFVVEHGLYGVHFWRNGADMASAAVRAKLDLFNSWVD